jgi:phosphoglycolate phosphatase-like HAD superfamily hydrolase
MKLIVFDFDGVIVDSKRLWASAVYRALKKRGYKFSEGYISERLREKLKISLGKLKVKVTKDIIDDVHDDVTKHIGTIHLCRDIKHIKEIKKSAKTVILTNSLRYFIMKALGSKKSYFNPILCAEDFGTKEDAIKSLMKKFKAGKNETFYVGDMTIDPVIAKKAGCKSIIVLAHSWDKDFWKGKKYNFIIKNLSELKNAI